MSGDALEKLLNAPVLFGLRAQGKFDLVDRMVKEGKSWEDIGRAIGWMPDAVRKHYEWAKEKPAES